MVVTSPRALAAAAQVGTSSHASPHLPCPGAGFTDHARDVVGGVGIKLSASSSPGG